MSEEKPISVSGNAEGASTSAARVTLTEEQLAAASRDELLVYCKQQQDFVDSQTTRHQAELAALRQQLADSSMREKVLNRRVATKERDLQEYVGQLSEMKRREAPGVAALRQALLDPAVNLLVTRLRRELADTRKKLEDTQSELSAWKFTPDSNTGKRLMAKCRLLYQENEELGRVIASGRVAKLEGELALQKSFCEEVKKSQSELDEFLQELDEDVEGMQSTILYLQQELRKAKEQLAAAAAASASAANTAAAPSSEQRQPSPPPLTPPAPPPCNGTATTRGRTTSEDSDDQPLSKKIRRDSAPDDATLANGQAEASESSP